jgi:polyisoprenoid-binding protein YceI
MTFRSTGVQGADDEFTLSGELTIGDVTRPVDLDVEFGGLEMFPGDGRRHAGFEAVGQISRRDFGLSQGLLAGTMLGDSVKVELDVQFVEPAEVAA